MFKKIIYSALLGFILLTPLTWLQVHFQICEYKNPNFFELAWWAPASYSFVFVLMTLCFPPLERMLTATFAFKAWSLLLEFTGILVAFMGPIFTKEYPYLMVFILSLYVLFRLGFFHAKWDWLFFLLGATIGPTLQIFLISFDWYHFTDPDFLGIPYWLPLLCGIVSMAGRRVADVIEGQNNIQMEL